MLPGNGQTEITGRIPSDRETLGLSTQQLCIKGKRHMRMGTMYYALYQADRGMEGLHITQYIYTYRHTFIEGISQLQG